MYLENFKYSISVSNSPLMPLPLLASVLENLGPDQHSMQTWLSFVLASAFHGVALVTLLIKNPLALLDITHF